VVDDGKEENPARLMERVDSASEQVTNDRMLRAVANR